jgi:hypothetical protein
VPGDVSDEASAKAIVSATAASGKLELVINNAGVAQTLSAITRQDPSDWERVMVPLLPFFALAPQPTLPGQYSLWMADGWSSAGPETHPTSTQRGSANDLAMTSLTPLDSNPVSGSPQAPLLRTKIDCAGHSIANAD